jgi:hypothetical protein
MRVNSVEAFKNGEIARMPNWDENYWAAIENKELSRVAGKVGYSILSSKVRRRLCWGLAANKNFICLSDNLLV